MRNLLVVVAAALGLTACNTVTSENEQAIAVHLENAAQYYDAGHYERAMQQWQKVLDEDSRNDKARLGQGMALYQMGREDSAEGVQRLAQAQQRLEELREEDLDDQQWKVQLGLALVHQRWVELYDLKVRKAAADRAAGRGVDQREGETVEREMASHVREAEVAYHAVLASGDREPVDRLTAWLGLARLAAVRGDLEASLEWAGEYERQIEKSKALWKDMAERSPKEAAIWEAKYDGAELQQADVHDLMGSVLFKLGRADEAEAQLEKVLAIAPERASAWLNRGILRQARGDWDLARGDFRQFLALTTLAEDDPAVLEAARRLAEVEERVADEDASFVPGADPQR